MTSTAAHSREHPVPKWRWVLAVLLAAASALFGGIWVVYSPARPTAELGIEFHFTPEKSAIWVQRVFPGSAAERADLRIGDALIAVNGQPLKDPAPFFDAVARGEAGGSVALTLLRDDPQMHASQQMEIVAVLHAPVQRGQAVSPWAQTAGIEFLHFYPLLFFGVGFGVLFLRLNDRNAWLLALLFSAFISAVPMFHIQGAIHPALRPFAFAFKVAFSVLAAPLFYFFFAVFPAQSPLDKRLPWLKWTLLAMGIAIGGPLAVWTIVTGNTQSLLRFFGQAGIHWRYTPMGAILEPRAGESGVYVAASLAIAIFVLGLLSLLWNAVTAVSLEARRKTRVIVFGTAVGMFPMLTLGLAAVAQRRPYYAYPFWVWVPTLLASFVMPASFAYAVVRHKVLEIPALLRQSARYLLVQKGSVLLMFLLCAGLTVGFGTYFTRMVVGQSPGIVALRLGPEDALPMGMAVGVAFGILVTWAGGRVERRVTQRIDKAFFRSAYDARRILEDLAERAPSVTRAAELAGLLEEHIVQAFHPKYLAIYLSDRAGALVLEKGSAPPALQTIARENVSPESWEVLQELAQRGDPWDVPPMDAGGAQELTPGASGGRPYPGLAALEPDVLVPIAGILRAERNSEGQGTRTVHLVGLISIGPRRSEEPYSGEDLRLLESVANQAGIALEGIRLAEDIARRIERDRRSTIEIQIAKEVQARLFPQTMPPLATLEYAGTCKQARTVGGDYYDFFAISEGRVALMLADVAGKGISAALLMAHLQANFHSQAYLLHQDLPKLLAKVNHLFVQATVGERFATMFIGVYDDATRRLRYVNCGHNPPYLLRRDGQVEKLDATALVLGLVEPWECQTEEITIEPGDTLVIYSDGATDATSDAGVMFEEPRLRETVLTTCHLPVPEMMAAIAHTIEAFTGTEAEDDVTLLVARGK